MRQRERRATVMSSEAGDSSSSSPRLCDGPPEKTNSCSASVSKRFRMSPSGSQIV